MYRIPMSIATILTVSACGAPMAGFAPDLIAPEAIAGAAPQPGTFSATARLAFDGRQGYRLRSTLTAYGAADVSQIKLYLLKNVSGSFATIASKSVTISDPSELAEAIPLTNLKSASSYQLRVEAFATGNVRIDTGVAADNTSATFTTPTGNGTSIDTATIDVSLPLKLKDKTFVGQAESVGGITVSGGTIVDTTASEAFL